MGPCDTSHCKRCGALSSSCVRGLCTTCIDKAVDALEKQDKCPYYAPERGKGTGRNASILNVTYQFLESIIGLDEDHYVVDVLCDTKDRSRRTLRLVVQGPKMHANFEGSELPWISIEELKERLHNEKNT